MSKSDQPEAIEALTALARHERPDGDIFRHVAVEWLRFLEGHGVVIKRATDDRG